MDTSCLIPVPGEQPDDEQSKHDARLFFVQHHSVCKSGTHENLMFTLSKVHDVLAACVCMPCLLIGIMPLFVT